MRLCAGVFVLVLSLGAVCAVSAAAEDLSSELELLAPFTGPAWVGHYSDPETAHFVHLVTWESVLGGRAVRAMKQVEELDFQMETLYYWDPEAGQVRFVSLTNRGQVLRGVVSEGDGLVVLLGEQLEDTGATPFRQTFSVVADGTFEDKFYLKNEDEWVEQHFVVHAPASSGDADPGHK